MFEIAKPLARGLAIPIERRLRALLADDHEQMGGAVERILGEKFEVQQVPDGRALLDAVSKCEPDVIILDISMPKMSGLDALAALRERGADLPPTVICSMHRDLSLLNAALDAGAHGYVYKAHAPFDLAEAVNAALEGRRFVSSGIGENH